eukprot:CAMPEP_0113729576 /NCGR_PEP_ID=MMETSP0038_2-20120614/42639_1 /TAXON_ID=2898 /ORGANISM="Cryptomonas paramecium" /LENGTH=62 /DNA_ID=CAMNT_0000661459 /DNA_START=259 /DNA_END=444 /DNA_ORIENTATION=+ /assembly_acc=CAM_ASM_000170
MAERDTFLPESSVLVSWTDLPVPTLGAGARLFRKLQRVGRLFVLAADARHPRTFARVTRVQK